MSDIDLKQFGEFSESLKGAMAAFASQKDTITSQSNEISALKLLVSDLEKRVLTIKANDALVLPGMNTNGFGFHDSASAKQFVQLMKSIFIRDPMVKDLTEGVDSEGGFTVPTEQRNTILSLMETYGLGRQRCTVLPIKTNEFTMPKLTGGVRVYWIGEGKTIPETQPSFGELKMIVKKLAALVPITSELLDDTSIAIANLLATLFAQALAKEEDRVVFMGNVPTNSDPFNGVMFDPDVNVYTLPATKTSFNDLTADDLANVISNLSTTLIQGAQFYMHRTVFNVIRKLKDSQGQYIYSEPNGQDPGMIWGYPFTLTESLPSITDTAANTKFLFFGNLEHYYIADRMNMSVARSEHVGFANDRVYLRVIQREGMGYALPETGIVIKTAAS